MNVIPSDVIPSDVIPSNVIPSDVIMCRNKLEADFESLVAIYVDPSVKIDISGAHDDTNLNENVTIETIVDFYVCNEKEIDLEGVIRAFITSVHFAKNEDSAALSKWFVEIRPDIMSTISPQLMVTVLTRKLDLMLIANNTNNHFMSEYIKWLIGSYCEKNKKQNNRQVLTTFVNRINGKMKNNKIILRNSLDKSFPTMIIYADKTKVANFALSTYHYLSDLYDQNS